MSTIANPLGPFANKRRSQGTHMDVCHPPPTTFVGHLIVLTNVQQQQPERTTHRDTRDDIVLRNENLVVKY